MLPHWPHDLWCQRLVGRDALFPTVKRPRYDRLVPLVDPVDEDLAVLLELPHGVADVGDAIFVGQHRATVDLGLDPGGSGPRLAGRQVGRTPFGAEAGKGGLSAVVALIAQDFLRCAADFATHSCRLLLLLFKPLVVLFALLVHHVIDDVEQVLIDHLQLIEHARCFPDGVKLDRGLQIHLPGRVHGVHGRHRDRFAQNIERGVDLGDVRAPIREGIAGDHVGRELVAGRDHLEQHA